MNVERPAFEFQSPLLVFVTMLAQKPVNPYAIPIWVLVVSLTENDNGVIAYKVWQARTLLLLPYYHQSIGNPIHCCAPFPPSASVAAGNGMPPQWSCGGCGMLHGHEAVAAGGERAGNSASIFSNALVAHGQ